MAETQNEHISQLDFKLVLKQLKQSHLVHVQKSQLKVDADSELMDVVREYATKRMDIEIQYSKSMDKLAKSLIHKKFKKHLGSNASPLIPAEESSNEQAVIQANERLLYKAVRTILVEAEKQAIQREKAAHDTFEKVSESIKLFNKERAVLTRKNVDYGAKYHQEIWQSYEDLELFRAAYEKAAKEYDIYIKKHDDATKHPKSGLRALKNLVKGTDSEERLQKLSRKLKAKERGMNDCRNDYILALKAVNGLHGRYYKEDLPLYLEKMDGHFYKALSKAYEQFLIADQLYFDQIKGSSIKLGEGIPQLVRTVDAAYFVKENDAVFKMPADIKFEMCDPDKSCEISLDEVTKVSLGQKLGILLRRDDLLLETQSCLEKQVDAIGQLAELYTENPKGTASPYEQQTELQNQIDLIKCQRWTLFVKIKTLEDLASILKLYIVAPIAPTADEEAQLASPTKVKIVTAFTATQLDKEVSVGEGEEVIVLAADIDGWTKVKVAKSSFIGIIPTSCIGKVTLRERGNSLKPAQSSNGPPVVRTLYGMIALIVDYTSIDETELSFKAGDIIECVDIFPEEEWWVGRLQRNGEIGAFPVNFTRDWEAVAAQYAKGHGRVASATTTLPNVVEKVVQQVQQDSKSGNVASPVTAKDFADFKDLMANATKQIQAKAIYSYDATCKGELSIVAGEIITVTSQDIGSEDWWEGTGQKGQGQFPKSYVQVVEANSRTPSNHPKRVRALYDFAPTSPGEIGFKAGAIIAVTEATSPDWWDGEVDGKTGAFPANYVEAVDS